MFYANYPRARLRRRRLLQVRGRSRGLAVLPRPLAPFKTTEIAHGDSALVWSQSPGTFYVVEWGPQETELHEVYT